MNIDDKFISSFFRVCVKLYNYDCDSDNDIEIKSLSEFINKCNEKFSIIEDNELLNNQISDLSKQIIKITKKYNETEKRYVNLYNDLRDCRTELKSIIEEKEIMSKNIDELYFSKTKYEKDIELKNQQLKQIIKKYNDNKAFWKNLLIDLEEQNNNYQKENEELSELNNKYIDEIKKIEEFKKSLCNKLSSDAIEKIDVSIVDMIEKANEYEKKYNELSTHHNILKNNYDDLNDKYKELISIQTNEKNELKEQIKLLTDKIENLKRQYNDNIIVMETKNKIIENQKGGNEVNIKYFDVRDKKAFGQLQNEILLFNEKNDDDNKINKQSNNRYKGENICYSTDYMVDLLKVSDKVKSNIKKYNDMDTIKEIQINESDTTDDYRDLFNDEKNINDLENNSIFIKKNISDSNDTYINIENMKILNDSDDGKNNKEMMKKELNDFILNNRNTNNIIHVGSGKKNKIEIRQIDDMYKMKFDSDFSTLTEQNINFNDEKLIKKIRHRKYMRHIREKNKLEHLREIIT